MAGLGLARPARVGYDAGMIRRLRITEFEGEPVLLLPDDLLAHLGVSVGDSLQVVHTPQEVRLERAPAAAGTAAELLDRIMDEDRDILSALARSDREAPKA